MKQKIIALPVLALLASVSAIGFANAQTSDTPGTWKIDMGNGNSFDLPYSISGGTIDNIKVDTSIPKMVISISANADGHITLQIPGGNNQNDFTVLVDGQAAQFTQSIDNGHRMVSISFHANSSTIEIVGNHQASQYNPPNQTISCNQDNMTAAREGLDELEKKMADLRTQYYNEWHAALSAGQYNGTWEQYSNDKVMNSPDVAQLKSEYQKYTSMLNCGPRPMISQNYSSTTCSQTDIANARQELETTAKQGMDLQNKMYQQFQQSQSSGQFNGTWNQYAQENFYNLPDVTQLKSTYEKYSSFLKSCFGNQMPPMQPGMPNPSYTISPPTYNMGPSPMGNDLGLGNNYPNMPQNNQNQMPQVSGPTDALGIISSSQKIPGWVKGIAGWWAEGKISDDEFVSAIKFLVHQGIIKI